MSHTNQIIRDHNDRFRRGDPAIPGQVVMTSALGAHAASSGLETADIVRQVQSFEAFTQDNDPYQQHDFGSFNVADETCFWKVDLYDPSLTAGTEDPVDLQKTFRVLTIMLASDY
ncbi:MAG: DUF3768 domain-containing protein [Pseudomonadota bacterium]